MLSQLNAVCSVLNASAFWLDDGLLWFALVCFGLVWLAGVCFVVFICINEI